MVCSIVFITVYAATSIPGCSNGGNANVVSVNNQFITIGSSLELSCNVSGISQHDIDLYHIANHTAHNVTNKRTDNSVIAEFGSVTRHDNFGWYCCCQGNCYNGSIGSVFVFVGERPKNDVNMECSKRSDNTIFCTWTSDDDCILWRVFYLSKSTNKPMECTNDSTSCDNCPSSMCYIRSATTGASLCRQCTIPLQEDVEVNEYLSFQFHGENLWGNTQFNKSIMIEETRGPLAGPELDNNCYIVKKHSVLIYFKKIKWSIARGIITGYRVILHTTNKTTTFDYSADSLTVDIPVVVDTDDIDVEIYSRNEKGLSIKPSYLHVAKPVLNLCKCKC